ncbi:hypothetical protein B9Z19DRAFT_1085669 [Tuber borchii]|uniref:Uncharacterized protein n=1 Tax=Tuber borchii TaxID=42251 RepID=A0A2T6ZQD4_TUBBO|nr:hypothetical protein B9Z19DRAFT_1085669 [Tuber borchii]
MNAKNSLNHSLNARMFHKVLHVSSLGRIQSSEHTPISPHSTRKHLIEKFSDDKSTKPHPVIASASPE